MPTLPKLPVRPKLPRLPKLPLPGEFRNRNASRHGHESAETRTLREMRRAILDGSVAPGSVIVPTEAARRFGVDHLTVCQSLPTLMSEGLVEHRYDSQYAATSLGTDETRELRSVREALESVALAAAVTKAASADHRAAQETYDKLEQAVHKGDSTGYRLHSRQFHLALIRPAGMHRLAHLLESAWNMSGVCESHTDHRRQLDAFLARDVAELLLLAEQHHAKLLTV